MHAYLIVAHKNLNQLTKLIRLLDNKNNDIYIHIDKKASAELKKTDYSKLCKFSKVYSYVKFNVNWGSGKMVETEMLLLEEANRNNKYEYYHLLSGLDLPLKSQTEIHNFFNKNKGKEFINFSCNIDSEIESINKRLKYYSLSNYYSILPFYSIKIMRRLERLFFFFQKIIGINRLKKYGINRVYKGANWFSITNELVSELLNNKTKICKIYKNSLCCDEVFIQTFIVNKKNIMKRLYIKEFGDNYKSIMRNIDWNRGKPYVWRNSDFDELINSDYLFARKFDEKIDKKIIDNIYGYLKENGEVNEKE